MCAFDPKRTRDIAEGQVVEALLAEKSRGRDPDHSIVLAMTKVQYLPASGKGQRDNRCG